jgi:hypothetical protein
MDIGKIIREVEVVREVEPEPFPFDPEPVRRPVPDREPAEPGTRERAP